MVILLYLTVQEVTAQAADNQTYTQPFQNETTTLSGKSVVSNMYFTKMSYWNLKKANFNFNYQISQLASSQMSDITVSVNGVKFDSFRPKNESDLQTEKISIPLNLIQGSNKLQISGQILDQDSKSKNYQLSETPANWLTIGNGSNVNFEYQINEADNTLSSFYNHFSGKDTIAYQKSKIATSDNPTSDELTASMIALSGESRMISTDSDQIPVVKMNQLQDKSGDYSIVISTYNNLPSRFKSQIKASDLNNQAVLKTYYTDGKHYLLVTARDGKLLEKAARFVANEELMKETTESTKQISLNTDTDTSILQDNGTHFLTTSPDRVEGAGHRENSYFVQIPSDQTNADGSRIDLHFKYSKNLDFTRSLVTIYLNNTVIGSKKLSDVKADGDDLSIALPKNVHLNNNFSVRVAFDLEMKDQDASDNSDTPWAEVEPESKMIVKSERSNDLLFSNYPTLFIDNETYDHLAVVTPKHLNNDDFKTLTNIFNLIGLSSKNNTGSIQFYKQIPNKSVLRNNNVIVIGTPKNNPMIKSLNPNLYFKYSNKFDRIVSNEKLSIEKNYGKNIGTAQLLRSPYNDKRGMLVVTGVTSKDIYLASTQINFQNNVQEYTGDAIVVDMNNTHRGYRFKKDKAIDKSLATKQNFTKNSQLLVYLGLAIVIIIMIGVAVFLTIRKQAHLNGGSKDGQQK
ncbi:cellulose biosynthesis cyclic di-GMP-binding regulatory protein BcsB [Companilactobacillus zhachilii]|uniref:cellulose biosynthesis cyclic di-GMP-binding regulatory protein BcsB n=1 Tax=Companilactobacillus zhachilii TaxID=2304606 RepID=UPI0040335E59